MNIFFLGFSDLLKYSDQKIDIISLIVQKDQLNCRVENVLEQSKIGNILISLLVSQLVKELRGLLKGDD